MVATYLVQLLNILITNAFINEHLLIQTERAFIDLLVIIHFPLLYWASNKIEY